MDKNIVVKILNLKEGLKIYNNIKIVRIKSEKYNILIMHDYIPVIGEINGSVDLESEKDTISFKDIKGYYMHKKNEFSLVIKEE